MADSLAAIFEQGGQDAKWAIQFIVNFIVYPKLSTIEKEVAESSTPDPGDEAAIRELMRQADSMPGENPDGRKLN